MNFLNKLVFLELQYKWETCHECIYNPFQNILRPSYEMEESKTFMESLIANFVRFPSSAAKFLFLEKENGRLMSALNFEIFLNILVLLKLLGNS